VAGIRAPFSSREGVEGADIRTVKKFRYLTALSAFGLFVAGCDGPPAPPMAAHHAVKELHVKIVQRMSDQMARAEDREIGNMIIIGDPGWLAKIYDGDEIVFDGYFVRDIAYDTVGTGKKISPVYKNDPEATKAHELEQQGFKAQLAAEAEARTRAAEQAEIQAEASAATMAHKAEATASAAAKARSDAATKATADLRARSARELAELEAKAGAK
jgi:hypothetical protein